MNHLDQIHDKEIHDRRQTLVLFAGLALVAVFVVIAIGFGYGWW